MTLPCRLKMVIVPDLPRFGKAFKQVMVTDLEAN